MRSLDFVQSIFGLLVDRHPRRRCRLQVVHIDTSVITLLLDGLLPQQVSLETCAIVAHAVKRVGDGEYQQQNSENRKGCQTLPHRHILLRFLVDAEKLENEISQTTKITHNDSPRAELVLMADKVSGA